MSLSELLKRFETEPEPNHTAIELFLNRENDTGEALIDYFNNHPNRRYLIGMVRELTRLRKEPDSVVPAEDIMTASYLLGLHQQPEDCLIMWHAKNADFDTCCAFDLQLLTFAGVDQTLKYLHLQNTEEAKRIIDAIEEEVSVEGIAYFEEYFSPGNLPWYL